MAVGDGARTRRRGVRSRWRRRWGARDLWPPGGDSENESALAAEVEGDGLGAEDGGEDAGGAARRRASPAESVWSVSRWAAFIAPARTVWSMVTGHGGSGLGVQVVGGQVFEELGERESAAVPPVEGTVMLLEPGSRMRRGAVMASMTLPSMAAARAGMVKWPVVVPSPLSCRVSEHLSRAACSSLRMSSFSWASTIVWSGSTASIARRARRRSWSGLNRAAFSTRDASTVWRCSSVTPSGSCPVARTITAACSGETRPASSASAVAS